MKIFLDLDGVCCDWMLAALALIKNNKDIQFCDQTGLNEGKTPEEVLKNWQLNQRSSTIRTTKFWGKLAEQGHEWWANLKEFEHYKPMLELLRNKGTVTYLTASPYGVCGRYASYGKTEWIQKREGEKFRRFIITHHKEECAGPDTVLIDDSHDQCMNFIKAGGKAIKFPQPWNGQRFLDSHRLMAFLTAAFYKLPDNDGVLITTLNTEF